MTPPRLLATPRRSRRDSPLIDPPPRRPIPPTIMLPPLVIKDAPAVAIQVRDHVLKSLGYSEQIFDRSHYGTYRRQPAAVLARAERRVSARRRLRALPALGAVRCSPAACAFPTPPVALSDADATLARAPSAPQRRAAHPARAAPVRRAQALRPLPRRCHQGAPSLPRGGPASAAT